MSGEKEAWWRRVSNYSLSMYLSLREQRTTTSKEASISLLCDGRTDVPSLSPRGRCLNGRRRRSLSPPAAVMRVLLSVRLLSNFSRARHCSGSFPRTSTKFMFNGRSDTYAIWIKRICSPQKTVTIKCGIRSRQTKAYQGGKRSKGEMMWFA